MPATRRGFGKLCSVTVFEWVNDASCILYRIALRTNEGVNNFRVFTSSFSIHLLSKKIPASATWQGDRMKFRRELIQEKAMAETMRDDKGTTKFNNCQYLSVVFLKKA
jgi:hypothetical protein